MRDLTEGIWDAISKLENGADASSVAGDLRVLVSPDVLPCPCCGSEAELYDIGQWDKQVKCGECGLSSGVGPADIVINAWNRRVEYKVKVEYADQLIFKEEEHDRAEDGSVRQDQQ